MNTQLFMIEEVKRVSDVLANWDFFREGLGELNRIVRTRQEITEEALLKTLLHIASQPLDEGNVIIIRSKNGKPLLWGAATDNTGLFKPRTCVVYAVYSNGKANGVVSEAIQYLERWARDSGFTQVQAFSPCFNGSRFRLFERVWGFKRTAVVFSKEL